MVFITTVNILPATSLWHGGAVGKARVSSTGCLEMLQQHTRRRRKYRLTAREKGSRKIAVHLLTVSCYVNKPSKPSSIDFTDGAVAYSELYCWQAGSYRIRVLLTLKMCLSACDYLPPPYLTPTGLPPLAVHTQSYEEDIANPRRFLPSDMAKEVTSYVPDESYTRPGATACAKGSSVKCRGRF